MKFLLTALFFCYINAQSQDVIWSDVINVYNVTDIVSSDMANDGDVIMVGTSDVVQGRYGSQFVFRRDNLGNTVANHLFDGSLIINQVKIVDSDSYIICGHINSTFSFDTMDLTEEAFFVAKVNNNGSIVWMYTDDELVGDVSRMAIDNNDNIYVTANETFSFTLVRQIVKLNHEGAFMQREILPQFAFTNDIITDNFGNVYITGIILEGDSTIMFDTLQTTEQFGPNAYKNYVLKYDTNLEAQWVYEVEGFDVDFHQRLAMSNTNLYWYHTQTFQELPLPQMRYMLTRFNLNGEFINDVVVNERLNFDSFGMDISTSNNTIDVLRFETYEEDSFPEIVSYNEDLVEQSSIIVDAFYKNTMTFASHAYHYFIGGKIGNDSPILINEDTVLETSQNLISFMIVLDDELLSVNNQNDPDYKMYPNPIKEGFKISGLIEDGYSIKIYDASGRLVDTTDVNKNEYVSIKYLVSGLYVYTILNKNNNIVKRGKFIKQ